MSNRLIDETSPYLVQHAPHGMHTQLPCMSGVYQIKCIPTHKIYIGSANNLRERWRHHLESLRRGDHRNAHLQNAWDRYGEENFEFTVLEMVDKRTFFE